MSSYPNRPLIGVGVIVFRRQAAGLQVLLVRRGKPPREGQWSLPGGRQRLGESVREAARREVAEETGCEVEITALLDVVDSITRDGDRTVAYHYTLIDFLAEWRAGEVSAAGDAAAAVWADPDALAPYELWSETLRLIALGRERLGD